MAWIYLDVIVIIVVLAFSHH